ncbi:MAG TPA: SDR family NAD(P)-dependent oxidoreductase, partial [Ohtaekwangia sp.]|nr:SDR family NAD(P)-dependent oxidoreductase [Ohtaekwangia sp.]
MTYNVSLKNAATWAAVGAGVYLAALLYKSLTRFNFDGKVVLITGGSRGLGLTMARQLADKGARLAICARTVDQLGQAHVELEAAGAEVMSLRVDVTDPRQVQEMVEDVIRHYGRLDVLINNAGVIQIGPQDAMDIKDYEVAMKSNFWSALYTMLAAIPHFKNQRSGRIVNI